MDATMDDGYLLAAAKGETNGPRKRSWFGGLIVVLVAAGLLITIAAIETRRSAPQVAAERSGLIDRVEDQTAAVDRLRQRTEELEDEVGRLQTSVLAGTETGQALQQELNDLGVLAGTAAVTGPGVRIVLDDAPAGDLAADPSDGGGRVLDIDLQIIVNGLWAAGAEAIAVNGQRINSRAPIRGADQAITVGYRPLARPYVVEAIGDSDTLEARFAEGPGGEWAAALRAEEHIGVEISTQAELELPASSGIRIRYVEMEGSQ